MVHALPIVHGRQQRKLAWELVLCSIDSQQGYHDVTLSQMIALASETSLLDGPMSISHLCDPFCEDSDCQCIPLVQGFRF